VITFTDVTAHRTIEVRLREALSALQSRFADKTSELDTARTLDAMLRKGQAVLEKKLLNRTRELRRTNADLKTEKERRI
jgi:hypothetical protein